MLLADQLDKPKAVILSSFKNYLFQAEVVKKHNSACFSLTLSSSFTRAHVPKKHTFGWEIGTVTYTLHTIVYER